MSFLKINRSKRVRYWADFVSSKVNDLFMLLCVHEDYSACASSMIIPCSRALKRPLFPRFFFLWSSCSRPLQSQLVARELVLSRLVISLFYRSGLVPKTVSRWPALVRQPRYAFGGGKSSRFVAMLIRTSVLLQSIHLCCLKPNIAL